MGAVETVTVLFTDVVRSTATASTLHRETADEIRRTHFEILRRALGETGGTEVKNLGDGLMAVFSSVGAAVAAAVTMQQQVERHARGAEIPVTMRVGISFGDATAEDGDYFGTPVIEAARLVAAAEAGQVLAHGLLARLVGPGGPELRALGDRDLKGLPEPVPVAEVVWRPLPADRELFTLPARLAPAVAEEFYGREDEVALLERMLAEATAGHRRAVLVSGEPGIGKTRLSAEIALTACAREAYVLYGRSEEGLGVPYQPILEAARHLVAHADAALLESYVQASGGDLVRLVPELADRVPGAEPRRELDGDAERYALFNAFDALVVAAAADRPVVMVLDDLHWADRGTVLLLRHVLTSPMEASVLTLLTFRSSDLPNDHPLHDLRTDLHRHGGVETLELSGLDVEDLESLLEVLAGQRLDEDDRAFVGMLHRETNGNPFFTREVLRHLVESGQLARTEGRWRARGPDALDLPSSVRDVLAQRVARLGATAAEVLTTASVIGRDFEVDLLERSVALEEDELLDVLDGAVEARLLVETDGVRPSYSFAHALVEHTLYASLSTARRARRHRRVGEALEAMVAGRPGSRIAELAHHWLQAGMAAPDKALGYAIAAAESAARQLAPQEAARWYAEALALLDSTGASSDASRCDVLIGLGIAQRDSGDAEHRETLLDAARRAERHGDAPRLVRAALANSRGFVSASGEVDQERIAALDAALAAVGEADSPARTLLLATLAGELAFSPADVERRLALSDEALAMARRLDDPLAIARVQSMRFVPSWIPETYSERLQNTAEGVTAAQRAGDQVTLFHNLHWHAYAQIERGEIDAAARGFDEQAELAAELRQPTLRWISGYDQATLAIIRGQLEDAEDLAGRALQLGMSSSQPDALPFYASQLSCIRYHQGRLGELVQLMAQTVEQNPGIPGFRSILTLAYAETDDDEGARRLLLDEASDGFSRLPRDVTRSNALAIFSLVCADLAEREVAEQLLQHLPREADSTIYSGVSWWGLVGHHRGNLARVLGEHAAAVECLEEAAAGYDRMGAPLWFARTQVDMAMALHARGRVQDRPRAERLLGEAEACAHEAGATSLERRAHELRSTGVAS